MIRTEDVAARWGGEEFIVLLSHTACDAAAALAERIRAAFEQQPVSASSLHLSASFGVVQLQESDDADTLIRRADAALYRAKHEGRNRVVEG
jgi:diguanylate cyclase (GGDEF)-like protein